MADDAAAIRAALAGLDAPAVVAGHSYTGVPLTEAAAGNDNVAHLVYVCAILPELGESTGSLMAEDPTPSRLGEAILAGADGMGTVDPDGALGWKDHPSTYILTTRDLVFSPALQRRMAARAGGVVEVDAGHIPLLSRPAELADAIASAADAAG
jgi:pimeloyl-ACP methyl ester carboxylesterase